MENLRLILPQAALCDEYLAMAAEFHAAGEHYGFLEKACQDFERYLQHAEDMRRGVGLPEGYVPYTTFWTLRDSVRLVGELRLRHRLTPRLEQIGGHIGYAVRVSERRKGYGLCQLGLGLAEALRLGLRRVLLTCDDDNLASARIIEANGGVLENVITPQGEAKAVRRYWIRLDGSD